LEEETDGDTQPTNSIIGSRGLEVSKEEEHALYVEDGVNIVQTVPGSRIHAQKAWWRLVEVLVVYGKAKLSQQLIKRDSNGRNKVGKGKKSTSRTWWGVLPCIASVISNGSDQAHHSDDENEALLPPIGVKDDRQQGEVRNGRYADLSLSLPRHLD
jgi:hypothetical protein